MDKKRLENIRAVHKETLTSGFHWSTGLQQAIWDHVGELLAAIDEAARVVHKIQSRAELLEKQLKRADEAEEEWAREYFDQWQAAEERAKEAEKRADELEKAAKGVYEALGVPGAQRPFSVALFNAYQDLGIILRSPLG